MKIWIGHLSCGLGHKKAAQALSDVFKDKQSLFCFDLLDLTLPCLKVLYAKGYAFLVRFLPSFWWLFFWVNSFSLSRLGLDFFHRLIFRRFITYIIKEDPKVVISTHFFISQIVSRLKTRGLIHAKLITVITDFGVYPLWVNKNTDYYVVAAQEVGFKLKTAYGVPEDNIKVWGIPLRRQFFIEARDAVKPHLKPKDKFIFLLFVSDLGLGPFKAIIDAFYKKCAILVIYGRNKGVEEYIKGLREPEYIRGLAYTEEIAWLMDSADVVVTKAGGLSVSECIARKRPMVFMSVIPGQEDYNAEFVVSKGLGFRPANTRQLIAILTRLKDDPSQLVKIKDNFSKLTLQDSALKIKELVLSLSD